jgi:tRNA(fMet)-specific endonuclease VapC
MIILDTDHVSLLQHPDGVEALRLISRLTASADQDVCTTVITVEEQMRGWLQVIARYRDIQLQTAYYDKLIEFVRFFSRWQICSLGNAAVEAHRELQRRNLRLASTDMKIAAICMAENAILLSRNLRDFQRIEGLRVEDWTVAE